MNVGRWTLADTGNVPHSLKTPPLPFPSPPVTYTARFDSAKSLPKYPKTRALRLRHVPTSLVQIPAKAASVVNLSSLIVLPACQPAYLPTSHIHRLLVPTNDGIHLPSHPNPFLVPLTSRVLARYALGSSLDTQPAGQELANAGC